LNKADVLAALYNRAQTGGMGFLQYDPKPMTREEAQQLLKRTTYFDYLKGRSMKVDLSKDEEFDATWYDHPSYNGEGSAEEAIEALRKTGDVNPASTQAAHHVGTISAAGETKKQLNTKSYWTEKGGIPTLHPGLGDVADVLGPAIDKAVEREKGS